MGHSKTEPAIGIDLGTTYSCVGVWRQNYGRVEIVVNRQGHRITPSCVAFSNMAGRLVGEPAFNQCHSNPTNTIFGVKRLIGRKFSDEQVQNHVGYFPFKVESGPNNKAQIVIKHNGADKSFFPEQISSMVLAYMREIAEEFLHTTVTKAVITVPAYFTDSQRRATQDAGTIAGLNILRIINEPTAAAIAYGLDNIEPSRTRRSTAVKKNILMFDLGGGTFDVTILVMGSDGELKVKATAGDTCLGGEDFDNRLLDHFVQEFRSKHRLDLRSNPKAVRRLKTACERAKRLLSFGSEAYIDVDCLHGGIDFQSKINRAKFEELNLDLFTKCVDTVERCLKDAAMAPSAIDEAVLVGGSTRIPKVQSLLEEYFNGKSLNKTINPDEAVAHGAAVLAAKLVGIGNSAVKSLVLMDVTPISLGTAVHGGIMTTLIPRNTPIPTKKEHVFVTVFDNQTSVLVEVYEGERALVKDNNLLGQFTIEEVPPLPAKQAMFNHCFEIDANGVLTVSSGLISSGKRKRKRITITNDRNRFTADEISKLVAEAETFKADDEEHRQKALAKSNLESLMYNLKHRLSNGYPGVCQFDHGAKTKLEETIQQVSNWMENNEYSRATEFSRRTLELESLWEQVLVRSQ